MRFDAAMVGALLAVTPATSLPAAATRPADPIARDAAPGADVLPRFGTLGQQPFQAASGQGEPRVSRTLYDFRLPPAAAASGSDRASSYYTRLLYQTTVSEPATWALMILGFGSVAAMMRRRRRAERLHARD